MSTPLMTPGRPRRMVQWSWPGPRRRRLSQPSIHLPLSSYLPGMKTGGAGSIIRSLGAKKSSVAWIAAAPRRGWARSTQRLAKSGSWSAWLLIGAFSVDWVGVARLYRGGVLGAPVAGDVDSPAEPYRRVPARIVEEAGKGCGAAGPADQSAMQADGHHAGAALAFGIEDVEAVLEIGIELVAGVEALARGKPHVVGVQRVGHYQLRPAGDSFPIGQL